MMRPELPRHLRAQLVLSALRWKFGPLGWRIFPSDRGRLWAFTDNAVVLDYNGKIWTGQHDSVDASSARELAAKIMARSA